MLTQEKKKEVKNSNPLSTGHDVCDSTPSSIGYKDHRGRFSSADRTRRQSHLLADKCSFLLKLLQDIL